jgi:lysophospholipase L1-like esterase
MSRTLFSTPARFLSGLVLPGILLLLPLACGGSNNDNPPPVVVPAPTISTQPKGAVLYEGHAFSLSVTAAGDSLTYQWMNGTTKIAGATTNTYAKTSATTTDSGNITVVVSNAGGDKTSSVAVLAVQALPAKAVAMPLISLNAPAYASNGTPATAVDLSGDTLWQANSSTTASTTPVDNPSGAYGSAAWIALDLSGVRKDKIMLQWSNYYTWNYESGLMSYDKASYNLIANYTIDAHAAAGGAANLPAEADAGWVTLKTETGNDYHSRQYLLDFTGYNWIRIHATAGNSTPDLNMEVHDATAAGANDSWLILGDSITAFAMGQKQVELISADGDTSGKSLGRTFPQLINLGTDSNTTNTPFTGNADFFPSAENGGVGAIKASDVALGMTDTHSNAVIPIDKWMAETQATYIGISYGTNDVNGAAASTMPTVAANLEIIVNKIIAAGKIPVLAKLIWSLEPTIQANGPILNDAIDALYVKYPAIIHGPDLWNALKDHPEFFRMVASNATPPVISQDTLHPNQAGERVMRENWAKAMLETIYRP